jgi:hypothetical protein
MPIRHIRCGEDISRYLTEQPLPSFEAHVLEEARRLGVLTRQLKPGLQDPVTSLSYDEVLARLWSLRGCFGSAVEDASGVSLQA